MEHFRNQAEPVVALLVVLGSRTVVGFTAKMLIMNGLKAWWVAHVSSKPINSTALSMINEC